MLLIPLSELHISSALWLPLPRSLSLCFLSWRGAQNDLGEAQHKFMYYLSWRHVKRATQLILQLMLRFTQQPCSVTYYSTGMHLMLAAKMQGTKIFVQYFESPLKVTEKGITEHAWGWTLATELGCGFRASSNLDPLIPHILEKNNIAYLLLHFMQVMRILKEKKCSLAQKHQEVSVFGLWALQFSPLFSLGWFLCYSEVEGGREITFFHPHLFQFSISIFTCTSSTAENCCIASLLRRQTQSPLEKKFITYIPRIHTSSCRSLLYRYIICWANYHFS